MKVVLFGNNERGCLCLETLVRHFEVPLVVALPRFMQPSWSRNILDVAWDCHIASCAGGGGTIEPEISSYVAAAEPDVIVLAGWPTLVSREIINLPTKMCVNLHAGPVPSYRGASVINWQIINGEKVVGISILKVTEGIDSGPVLVSLQFPVGANDTYTNILDHILDVYPTMLIDVLKRIDIIKPSPQIGTPTIYTKRFPRDGEIDWGKPDYEVHNLIRALTKPMPGAFTYHDGKKLIIERSKIIRTNYRGVPGRVAAHWDNGVVVNCGNRGLLLMSYREENETKPLTDLNGDLG